METTDIKGHLVLVTGAASGIGKEIATSFIKRGAIVAACDKNIAALQAIKNEVSNKDFHIFEVDFVNEDSIINCVSKVESDLGPLKAVVNCVGILGKNGEKVELVDIADFDLVYAINLRGALILTKAVIKGMADRGYGRILHMASISGKEGNPLLVAYSATKAGLIALVKSVGKEYATTGVTVNAMAPALIQSPMSDSFSEAQLASLKSRIPMNRLGKTSEVADMAAWIISPACSFTTGFAFDLTGGRATY
ncbi:MAG: SDR family NAD(P)-dependent oxidoreductase [Actinobacteria bacterium]|nr:SDR family NAD(P)-dependent oxidoreductase [Actinomycetota bacterium]